MMKDYFIVVVLLGLIIVRFFSPEENVFWIGIISYIGVLIATMDLYFSIYRKNKMYEKFPVIKGIFAILGTALGIVFVLIFSGKLKMCNKANDIFTLFALLIGLPKELYCKLVMVIVKTDF